MSGCNLPSVRIHNFQWPGALRPHWTDDVVKIGELLPGPNHIDSRLSQKAPRPVPITSPIASEGLLSGGGFHSMDLA